MSEMEIGEIEDILCGKDNVFLAYCFSRNDVLLRVLFGALPLVSYDFDMR